LERPGNFHVVDDAVVMEWFHSGLQQTRFIELRDPRNKKVVWVMGSRIYKVEPMDAAAKPLVPTEV
jgi:hypothetical protein